MITYTRNPIALSVPRVGTIYCPALAILGGLPFPQLTSQCRSRGAHLQQGPVHPRHQGGHSACAA